MKTIEKAVQSEINIKKSQFICSLFPTKSKKESKEIIQKLNHQYHDATITVQHILQMTVRDMTTTANLAELQANL